MDGPNNLFSRPTRAASLFNSSNRLQGRLAERWAGLFYLIDERVVHSCLSPSLALEDGSFAAIGRHRPVKVRDIRVPVRDLRRLECAKPFHSESDVIDLVDVNRLHELSSLGISRAMEG